MLKIADLENLIRWLIDMISMIWRIRGKAGDKYKTIAYIKIKKGDLPDWLPYLLEHMFNDYKDIKIEKVGYGGKINYYISKLINYILSLLEE